MHFLFADNFLTSSLLTILMPILLLLSIVVWYLYAVKRVPHDDPETLSAQQAQALRHSSASAAGTASQQPPQG